MVRIVHSPSPKAFGFCCEERMKELRNLLGKNAMTAIVNRDHSLVHDPINKYLDRTPVPRLRPHGVHSVEDQID